jgi:starvation-inducible DNA-binding protein
MFETRIDLSLDKREQLVALLNQHLADTVDLFSHTKEAHWNVKGLEFYQLHELYDEFAAKLVEFADVIAERATALGGLALGTVRRAASATRLEEYPLDAVGDQATVNALADRYAALAKTTREAIDRAEELDDKGTADMFTDISRELDKMLWFLEAHLQESSGR